MYGVEAGDECYCGSTLAYGAQTATPNGCTNTCLGNTGEICGGVKRINVYSAVTITPTSTASNQGGPITATTTVVLTTEGQATGGLGVGPVVGVAIGCLILGALACTLGCAVFFHHVREIDTKKGSSQQGHDGQQSLGARTTQRQGPNGIQELPSTGWGHVAESQG